MDPRYLELLLKDKSNESKSQEKACNFSIHYELYTSQLKKIAKECAQA